MCKNIYMLVQLDVCVCVCHPFLEQYLVHVQMFQSRAPRSHEPVRVWAGVFLAFSLVPSGHV